MKPNKFDVIMDYIDENIHKTDKEIQDGIFPEILISCNKFNHVFYYLTDGDTLTHYIKTRRLYFAAKELLSCPDKSICDIAGDCGYSDQSSFSRAFSNKYDMPPGEFRSKCIMVRNDKYRYDELSPSSTNSRAHRIMQEYEHTGVLFGTDVDYLEEIERGTEYFDIDTCYAIAELAERLDVPVGLFTEGCFHLVAEIKSDPNYISPTDMNYCLMGIRSEEDLEKICKHYNCDPNEVTACMVMAFHETEG